MLSVLLYQCIEYLYQSRGEVISCQFIVRIEIAAIQIEIPFRSHEFDRFLLFLGQVLDIIYID